MKDKAHQSDKDGGHSLDADEAAIKKWLWKKRINDTGPIYDPEDAAEIHEAMEAALKDDAKRKQLQKQYLEEAYGIGSKSGKAR